MAKYFISPAAVGEGMIHIEGDLARHLGQVLRVKPGEILRFSDGVGKEYAGAVLSLEKNEIKIEICSEGPLSGEPPLDIWLLQGIAKGEKMDFIVQKAVELGVGRILPLETANTVVKVKGKGKDKAGRWQKIAAAAAEQCGRGRIPAVLPPQSLEQAINELPEKALLLFLWEKATKGHMRDALAKNPGGPLILLIGPEGGFSPEEAEFVIAKGGFPISLGPRILRTETASIAALGALGYAVGDWGEQDA